MNFLTKGLSKLFGSISNRDIKSVQPLVEEINRHFASYANLSHNELRAKTIEFKSRILEYVSKIDESILELNQKAESTEIELEIDQKEAIFNKVNSS